MTDHGAALPEVQGADSTMGETYSITNFADLLKVPVERRDDCLRELQYALLLVELALGDDAYQHASKGLVWTDDGEKHASLRWEDGEELRLEITEGAAAMKEEPHE